VSNLFTRSETYPLITQIKIMVLNAETIFSSGYIGKPFTSSRRYSYEILFPVAQILCSGSATNYLVAI